MSKLLSLIFLLMINTGVAADPNKVYCMQALKAAAHAFRGVDRAESIKLSAAAARVEKVALDEIGNRVMNREEIRASFEGIELFSKDPNKMSPSEQRSYLDKSMREVSACLKLADALGR